MSLSLILLVLIGLFALVDFLVVHYVPATATGIELTILGFFKDVNAKVLALLNSIWAEVVKNWHEYAILGVIYLILFGLSLPLVFVYALIGYLLLRLIQDIFKV